MKRHILASLLLFALGVPFFAACENRKTPAESVPESPEMPETAPAEPELPPILLAEKDGDTAFQIVYNPDAGSASNRDINALDNAFSEKLNVSIRSVADWNLPAAANCEIIVGSEKREECAALTASLKRDEYAFKAVTDGDSVKILIAYKNEYARMTAIHRFIRDYIGTDKASVPADLDVRGKSAVITTLIDTLRDPSVLYEDGTYYVYGTGWVGYMNNTGKLDGFWLPLDRVAKPPAEADTNYWAPEVYKYNGAYYMFTTYHSTKTGHRGCTVMKADSPAGPFREISDGQVTPHDWDAIDGTLYVDPDGQPWMIFVHEWTSTDDGIGRMAAAKLSKDLTHFITEPVELFRADDAPWCKSQVTDGCWMYRCEDGQLLMLWSSSDSAGYCVGIARSKDGRVDGEWTHDETLLFSKNITGNFNGGHGMLFTDAQGQMYLSIHSPNSPQNGRNATPVFIPLKEENGTLVWDLD